MILIAEALGALSLRPSEPCNRQKSRATAKRAVQRAVEKSPGNAPLLQAIATLHISIFYSLAARWHGLQVEIEICWSGQFY